MRVLPQGNALAAITQTLTPALSRRREKGWQPQFVNQTFDIRGIRNGTYPSTFDRLP